MTPDLIRGVLYSNKFNLWSLGIIVFEMIYRTYPFPMVFSGNEIHTVYATVMQRKWTVNNTFQSNSVLDQILHGKIYYKDPNFGELNTEYALNLMVNLLACDPESRLTAEEVKENQFVEFYALQENQEKVY